ncbi:MAG: radical SAM family heme chaperone HemW [Flavobacteriales bacterium]
MAGIYIHIPFCNQACHYCDFHFSTSQKYTDEMCSAMQSEIEVRTADWGHETFNTIYFGGGTPSLLPTPQLGSLMDVLHQKLHTSAVDEVTLEANPEDLSPQKISELQGLGINRLSIGIQSFHDTHLAWMNRSHSSSDAERAVKTAQDKGITNITIDLIYSIPGMTRDQWLANLHQAIQLQVPHISAYSLTIESKTVFGNMQSKGLLNAAPDAESEWQYLTMVDILNQHHIDAYEVSNFAKRGMESKHNSAYWKGDHYIGIGPSAHSYSNGVRSWNVANNAKYMQALGEKKRPFEQEVLTTADAFNEMMMTRLRTTRGLNHAEVEASFGIHILEKFQTEFARWSENQWAQRDENGIRLTPKGMLFADRCAAELFLQQDDFT